MSRRALLLIGGAVLGSSGCQSIGRFPGIDPTDYAYINYLCNTTQVYPQDVRQVQSSALEAMADLGYTDIECEPKGDQVFIQATTLDGRPAQVTIRPRNKMSSMTVKIGVEGDEMVASALIQRVAMNFGMLPRTLVPIEPTLSRRIDPLSPRVLVVPPPNFRAAPPEEPAPPAAPDGSSPFSPPDPAPAPSLRSAQSTQHRRIHQA